MLENVSKWSSIKWQPGRLSSIYGGFCMSKVSRADVLTARALKAWETRRANAAKASLTARALKAWETRRSNGKTAVVDENHSARALKAWETRRANTQ